MWLFLESTDLIQFRAHRWQNRWPTEAEISDEGKYKPTATLFPRPGALLANEKATVVSRQLLGSCDRCPYLEGARVSVR